jgi:hypothetical protein
MLRKAKLSASTSELNDELLIADAECFAPPLRRPGLRLSISESDPGRLFEGEDLRAIRRIQGNEQPDLIMLPQEVGQQIRPPEPTDRSQESAGIFLRACSRRR